MNKLKNSDKKTIELEEIERIFKVKEYMELYDLVNNFIKQKKIIEIKNSGGNGKTLTLYKRYRLLVEKKEHLIG